MSMEMQDIYNQIRQDTIVENGMALRRMVPLDAPDCNFPGLIQARLVFPKGFRLAEGRRVVEQDMICDSDTAIRVGEKGYTVYADVYRPMGPEKVPAILCIGYGGKRDTNNKSDNIRTNEGKPMHWSRPVSGLQAWEGLDPAEWVPYGYAVVNVDPTGVCASEGNMRFFDEEDRRNGYDIIEAVAAMDWCTGKVALAGSSWLAMVQFSYAAAQPPHLTCIAPFESEGDPYRDEYVRGGIPLKEESFSLSYRTHGRNYMDDLGANARLHPLYDGYWAQKTLRPEEIHIPAFVIGGYTSPFHTRGAPDCFNRLASTEKWYRTHNTTEWLDLYTDGYMGELKRFFDHYLKGLDNGWEKTSRVRVGLLDPGGVNVDDQPEECYPPARMKPTYFYLAPAGMVLCPRPVQEASSARYDAGAGQRLTFRVPIDRELEIIGPARLHLWVEAQGSDDMDLFVRYTKLDRDGNPLRSDVGLGYYRGPDGRLRVSHRELDLEQSTELCPVHTHARRLPLSPGEIVPVDIQIWPTGMIFHQGEILELTVGSSDFTEDRPPNMVAVDSQNQGVHIIHGGGQYDSCLIIPCAGRKA